MELMLKNHFIIHNVYIILKKFLSICNTDFLKKSNDVVPISENIMRNFE